MSVEVAPATTSAVATTSPAAMNVPPAASPMQQQQQQMPQPSYPPQTHMQFVQGPDGQVYATPYQ